MTYRKSSVASGPCRITVTRDAMSFGALMPVYETLPTVYPTRKAAMAAIHAMPYVTGIGDADGIHAAQTTSC